ncbi:MAG: bifunctional DNA primase/polymerase [Deltaproteobacteria bacterium]|nr:bifunctional DNA primase/polymerase [Deltaproteobacteria bacterium]
MGQVSLRWVVEKLFEGGFYILSVRGRGKTLDEAKAPILPKGIRYEPTETNLAVWRSVTERAVENIRSGRAFAYGLPGGPNYLVIFDFDAEKVPVKRFESLWNLLAREGAYVEFTASGGVHVVLKAGSDELGARLRFRYPYDVKTFGYVIAAPSALRAEGKVFRYRKHPDAPWPFEGLATLREVEWVFRSFGIEVLYAAAEERHTVNGSLAPKGEIATVGGVSWRSWVEAVACLMYIAKRLGCEGYYRVLKSLLKEKKWIVPYRDYRTSSDVKHCRSTWGIVEYNLGAALRMINADSRHVEEFAEFLWDVQGEDPANTRPAVTQGWRYCYWGLDHRGACVLKRVGLCTRLDCDHNFVTLLLSRFGKVKLEVMRFWRWLNAKRK